jgi:hypothetical protein
MNRVVLSALAAVALVLSACQVTEASATDAVASKVRCGAKGPFYGRTDGYCNDTGMYGPLQVVNGSVDRAFSSSLMVNIFEDFMGYFIIPDVDTDDVAQTLWNSQDAGTAGCPARVADADDGQIELLLDNGNEVGDCTLYWGDEQNIDSDKEPVCIFRLQVEATPAAADKISFGLMTARNAIVESVSQFAAFSDTGADLVLDTESDDNTTDVAPVGTGVTLTAATFYEFKVSTNAMDGASPTNVKFFYRAAIGGDWTALNASTTFSLGADAALQPFVQVEKTSGTTTPGVKVEYIDCYWERS